MIPHCNGTHTETVSHIVNEDIWVGQAAMDVMTVAILATVEPEPAKGITENYRPALDDTDSIITAQSIRQAVAQVGDVTKIRPGALVVRSLPNEVEKCSREYTAKNAPPFFTVEAIEAINELGVRHLLVDFPSVDRINDDGLLTNHHLYWNVNEGSHKLSGETWQDKTITEMIFVEDVIADGVYVLNLQVPAFCSDAAPSRPVMFPARPIEK
jgi:arylformamidase